MNPTFVKSALLAILLAWSADCAATSTVINFTGHDASSSDVAFSNLSSSWSAGAYSVNYADANQVFPGDAANGAPVLSGGVYATNSDAAVSAAAASSLHINAVAPDAFQIGWAQDATAGTTFEGLFMAQDANWLGLNSGAAFNASSSLSIATGGSSLASLGSVNFVVKDAGIYYISQAHLTSTNTTLLINNPNTANWVSFNATSTDFGGINPAGIIGSQHTFTDIQALGFFVQGTTTTGGVSPSTIAIENWTVDASAVIPVPEPSSIGFSAFGLGAMAFCLRRRMAKTGQVAK